MSKRYVQRRLLWLSACLGVWLSAEAEAVLTYGKVSFSPASAQEGEMYQMRRGEQEQEDEFPLPPFIEWNPGATMVPGCFQKNSRLKAAVMVTWGPPPDPGLSRGVQLRLTLTRFREGQPPVQIWTYQSGITPVQAGVPLDFFPSSRLPNYIDRLMMVTEVTLYSWQRSQWQREDNRGGQWYLFTVLDDPLAPMSPAWYGVLRYACEWAAAQDNFDDAAQKMCFGLFFERPFFAYTPMTRWTTDDPDGDGNPDPLTFMLKAFLDTSKPTGGNCMDVSNFLMIACCAVGMDFSSRRLTSQRSPYAFTTNPICAIGSDPTQDWTYHPWDWGWHQVDVPTGAPSVGARIWNPSAAQKEDLNGNGYRNPPADHPTHRWLQEDYWQKPHPAPPPSYLGLVANPEHDTPLVIDTYKCDVSTLPWSPPSPPP